MAKKYNVVLSEQVTNFLKGLSKKDQSNFDAAMNEIAENPLKDAKPVSGGLIEVLQTLDEIGVNTVTMKMTKKQGEKFNKRMKEIFGEDYKSKMKEIANELKD